LTNLGSIISPAGIEVSKYFFRSIVKYSKIKYNL
jgi:hypothetical protein